jgi:rRNA-processing protein FCF1
MSKKIVFDTSFLIQVIELFSYDKLAEYFREWEFLIPESVYNELLYLSKSEAYSKRSKAGYVLDVIKKHNFKIIASTYDDPDKDVIYLARREEAVLATGDRSVRRRAKSSGIKVLYFRNSYPIID